MSWQFDVLAVPLMISAAITAVLGYVLWQRSDGRLFSADGGVALVQFAILFWSLGTVLMLVAVPLELKILGFYVSEVGIAAISPTWLLFALKYTGNVDWLSRRRLAVILGVVVFDVAVIVTNVPYGFHDLFVTNVAYSVDGGTATLTFDHGPFRYVHATFLWTVNLLGSYFIFQKFLASRNVYRARSFLLLATFLTIVLSTMISFTSLNPTPYFSLGPIVYTGFALLSLLALVSYRTLQYIPVDRLLALFSSRSKNLAPAARDVIMEEMDSGVLVLDHKNRLVDINPLARRMVGASDDRVIGKDIMSVVEEDIFVDGLPAFADPDVTEGTFSGVWVETLSGESRCFDVTVTPLTDGDDVTGRVLLIHDVTRREARKQKLEERTQELERQNDQLEEFASIVSHDLRNPLNVAKGAVDLVEHKDEDDPQYFEQLRQAHDRMESIIDDVLTLARQGQTVEETAEVDIGDAAEDAWDHVDTAGATLEVTISRTVEADPSRLCQMFENFFRNAIEHGREDVTITVGPLEDGFFVEDDGPGIPEEHRDEVLDKGFTTSESGTGFGLAIIETVIDAHGWEVIVTEGRDGGARFEITGVQMSETPEMPTQRIV